MVTARSVPGCVSLEVIIAVPLERVWRAITTPEEQIHYVPGVQRVQFEARVGGYLEFSGKVDYGGAYTVRGRIIEFDPPRRLVYTWQWEGSELPETTVSVTLEPVDGGTKVSHLHTGFPSQFEQARALHEHQRIAALELLKKYLEANP